MNEPVIPPKPYGISRQHLTAWESRQVVRLLKLGMSLEWIALKLHIAHRTVQRRCRDAGVRVKKLKTRPRMRTDITPKPPVDKVGSLGHRIRKAHRQKYASERVPTINKNRRRLNEAQHD